MSDRVVVTIEDGVADVRLNRPEKMNALDAAMFAALTETAHGLRNEPGVRVVVLSGEGRAFCAGLDFDNFKGMASDGDRSDSGPAIQIVDGRITSDGQEAVYAWTALEVPVIAAVHGVALGGGLQLALGADLRIVAPDARMSVLEIRWGLVPDMTGTPVLPALVGIDVAKELAFTGRMVEGTEAAVIGLATRVADDPRAEALELAADIAVKSPDAIRGTKVLLDMAGRASLAESFAAEAKIQSELIGSPNQVESVTAYFEQRAPVFTDPTG
ncbi:MAG: crotonase/enoyl-CoA hydratase family protein [Actinomycetota bacterium]